jgi:hypothetical protein
MSKDLYTEVTNQIVAALEASTVPLPERMRIGRPRVDLTSMRFGRLTAIRFIRSAGPSNFDSWWERRCDCGNIGEVVRGSLRRGCTRSCGCLARELTIERSKIHAEAGQDKTPEYQAWSSMIAPAKIQLSQLQILPRCPVPAT